MKKTELKKAVKATKGETKNALQLVYDNLNQGQKKKILKEEAVAKLFERYNVET